MKIRKLFTVESAHIVRNCTSHRCSHSIHGHSAKIEVFLTSNKLDNAGMVYDFGLMKNSIKQFIDSTDHCYLLWEKDDEEFKNFIKKNNDRWIELPFNPSAENLSIFYMVMINYILKNTQTGNGEGIVRCCGVRYHETASGYAECDINDEGYLPTDWHNRITFSAGVQRDWNSDLKDFMTHKYLWNTNTYSFVNPIVKQQV